MLFSVIIPTYNAADTVVRALDSVVGQRGATAEIIVVDDCSSDATLQMVESYRRSHDGIQVRRTPANGGPGLARNLGIEMARGDWICFLDSDDELAAGCLELLSSAAIDAERSGRPLDIIAFNWRYAAGGTAAPDGEREDLPFFAEGDRSALIEAYLRNRIDQSVIFHAYRREFLLEGGIFFRSGYHEDVDFAFRTLLFARGMAAADKPLYLKWDTPASIVNTLGSRHIDGYFDAIDEIYGLLDSHALAPALHKQFLDFVVNITASRLARLLRPGIAKVEESGSILQTLHRRVRRTLGLAGMEPGDFLEPSEAFRTRYQKMFAAFLQLMPDSSDTAAVDGLMDALAGLQQRSWSCYDLHNSVFLAPEEIRTCCKRFFHEGRMKGDVVLLRGNGDSEFRFSYDDILREKTRLHREINRSNAPECEGCPFLAFENWGGPLVRGVKYLSLEYHSVCNMRCTYCSPIYYGGKKATYDVEAVVDSLQEKQVLADCEYVVWGGGEPTVDKLFPKLLEKLAVAAPTVRQRVISNCTRYSEALARTMAADQAFVVVSIDAGSEALFREIRKYKGFQRVIDNVARYSRSAPENLIIKYIVMAENSQPQELAGFVDLMARSELLSSNFQISCDFKAADVMPGQMAAIASLYGLLRRRGARFVFNDDLIWQRLPRMSAEYLESIRKLLEPASLSGEFANTSEFPRIALWGTGSQARLLLEKSLFLRNTEIAYFVDPRADKIGTEFCGRPVHSPRALLEDGLPVAIAAVQSAPFIYRDIKNIGVPADRIITKLML